MYVEYDAIIIGAGAAGLMCAGEAGKRERKILVIDHSKKPGEKIRISGGGRCNFTNLYSSPNNFISHNPHFCVSALKRFSQHDFIRLVEKYHIKYHQKKLGQLFCNGSSKQIINMLLKECNDNVTIQLSSNVTNISKHNSKFFVTIEDKIIQSPKLVIATGGLSIPKMGATSFGYDVAKKFGINVIPPTAALVPFLLNKKLMTYIQDFSGISVDVEVRCGKKTKFREALLFTHRGLSGPAILQISSYWKNGNYININFLPDHDIIEILKIKKLKSPKQEIHNCLSEYLPTKLSKYLCTISNCSNNISNTSLKTLNILADNIHNYKILPDDTEGFRTAEVTLGGIDTNELSSKTFETKSISGLYFIGETIDVTGHLGGFNFQWAWSSGHAAGQAL